MRTVSERRGNQPVDVHYSVGMIPPEIEENFETLFPDHEGFTLEEYLLAQESVYQSLQTKSGINGNKASDNDQSREPRQSIIEVGESSRTGSLESQLALDEAFARSLQEMQDEFDDVCISGTAGVTTGSAEVDSTATTVAVRTDNVDPDNMSYEELQSLGDSIGTASKGLSDEFISLLPSYKVKTGGWFSKKSKLDNCVICHEEYRNQERLIALPCSHQYHSKCITRWLKLNKTCPVCTTEVFGS